MSKQNPHDLKDLFRQAAEIAKQVPETMQVAAFNRAIDLLTGTRDGERTEKSPKVTNSIRASTGGKGKSTKTPSEGGDASALIEVIDSTQYPKVRSSPKVLDRALMILQIARTEHGVDGLPPSHIAQILTDKFRVNTSDAAVRMALGKSTNLVNRVPRGKGFIYRIMGPGEDYLNNSSDAKNTKPTIKRRGVPQKVTAASRKIDAPQSKIVVESPTKIPKVAESKKVNGSKLQPKAAIISLIDSGFFSSPKTGPQVQQHLRIKRGFTLGTAQLSLAMLRLVRDGKLERSTNAEGQYEYKRS